MAGNLPGPPMGSLSRRELIAVLAGSGVVGAGVFLTGEAADQNRRTYVDARGVGSVVDRVEIGSDVPLVATVELLGEYPDDEAPAVAVELLFLYGSEHVFEVTDTGPVTERTRSLGSGQYQFRVEAEGEFRATLREQKLGLF